MHRATGVCRPGSISEHSWPNNSGQAPIRKLFWDLLKSTDVPQPCSRTGGRDPHSMQLPPCSQPGSSRDPAAARARWPAESLPVLAGAATAPILLLVLLLVGAARLVAALLPVPVGGHPGPFPARPLLLTLAPLLGRQHVQAQQRCPRRRRLEDVLLGDGAARPRDQPARLGLGAGPSQPVQRRLARLGHRRPSLPSCGGTGCRAAAGTHEAYGEPLRAAGPARPRSCQQLPQRP